MSILTSLDHFVGDWLNNVPMLNKFSILHSENVNDGEELAFIVRIGEIYMEPHEIAISSRTLDLEYFLRAFGKNGESYDMSYNMGLPLFDKGFVNFTVEKQFSNFTQYGGPDPRYINAQGVPVAQQTVNSINATTGLAVLSPGNNIPNVFLPNVKGYPRSNPIDGNPEVQTTMGEFNSAYDFSDSVQLYAFGTFGHKFAKSFENERLPNQIVATIGSNQPCSATNPDGYNTGSSTQIGATGAGIAASCTGPFTLSGSQGAPGTPGGGINSKGYIISSGQAGNLFSNNLINAQTGARLPSPTGAGTLSNVTELVAFPGGFRPMEVLKEDDYQYDVGVK